VIFLNKQKWQKKYSDYMPTAAAKKQAGLKAV